MHCSLRDVPTRHMQLGFVPGSNSIQPYPTSRRTTGHRTSRSSVAKKVKPNTVTAAVRFIRRTHETSQTRTVETTEKAMFSSYPTKIKIARRLQRPATRKNVTQCSQKSEPHGDPKHEKTYDLRQHANFASTEISSA